MRKKVPENETQDDKSSRQYLEQIAAVSTRKEKVSWSRKMDNMIQLLGQLKPIDEKILDLQARKQPIMDEITTLRELMVRECVHPIDQLVHVADSIAVFGLMISDKDKREHAVCKFCNKKLVLSGSGLDE